MSSLLDLVKAFDSVPFDWLAQKAARVGYNLIILRLSLAAYSLARVLDIEGCVSGFVWASRGLAAGSVLATIELRVLLIEAADAVVASCVYCRLTLYVDDATIETVCTMAKIVQAHAASVNLFVSELSELRLTFSDKKNVVCATTRALAEMAADAFDIISVTVAQRVTSLGSGLGAGKRRNMLNVRKRLKAFRARGDRFKNLRAAGCQTDRLLRTGGIAALTFGQRALGVSDSMLLHQRRAAAECTRVSSAGANLDLNYGGW